MSTPSDFFTEFLALLHRHFTPPTPAPTPAPAPSASPVLAIMRAVGAVCPVYDNAGNKYDQSGQLASGEDSFNALLREGVSAQTIETYLIGQIKGYPADQLPAGVSYAKGWQQAIDVNHSWATDMERALKGHVTVTPLVVPAPGTLPSKAPGPSIG